MNIECLTEDQVWWAFEKAFMGYTNQQIGDALHVSEATIRRAFKKRKLNPRDRPKLDPARDLGGCT